MHFCCFYRPLVKILTDLLRPNAVDDPTVISALNLLQVFILDNPDGIQVFFCGGGNWDGTANNVLWQQFEGAKGIKRLTILLRLRSVSEEVK